MADIANWNENWSRASDNVIQDPGDGKALPISKCGQVALLIGAGSETNTMGDPIRPALYLQIVVRTTSGGSRAITFASQISSSGDNVVTLTNLNDIIFLLSVPSGSGFRWHAVDNSSTPEAFLSLGHSMPSTIYGLEGRELNIYFRNFIKLNFDISTYRLDVVCTKGEQDDKRWFYTPVASDAGNLSWSLNIYFNNVLVKTITTTIVIKTLASSGNVTRKLLVIGDSTTSDGTALGELQNLFATNYGGGIAISGITRPAYVPATAALTSSGNVATVTTTLIHRLQTGDSITVAGANQAEYNVTATITVTTTLAFTYAIVGAGNPTATGAYTISAARAFLTTKTAHGLTTGNTITVSGAAQAQYNVTATATVVSTTGLTYTITGAPVTPATGTFVLITAADPGPMTLTLVGTQAPLVAIVDSNGVSRSPIFEAAGGATIAQWYTSATVGSLSATNNLFIAGAFNFGGYLSAQAITMSANDWVMIHLGINDVFGITDDATLNTLMATMGSQITGMIASIKAGVVGIRIGLLLTIPPNIQQDAFGTNYGSGATAWRHARNVELWREYLIANYSSITNVKVFAYQLGLDMENNTQTTATPLNTRNTTTYVKQTNGIHPAASGYYQMADMLKQFLKGLEA